MNRELSPALKKVIAAYARELPAKFAEIQRTWEQAAAEQWPADQLEELYHQVHKLAGSSGSYGFKDVSLAARALDRALSDVRAGEATWDAVAAQPLLDAITAQIKAI